MRVLSVARVSLPDATAASTFAASQPDVSDKSHFDSSIGNCVRKQPDVDHCRVNFSNESACNGESACAWNGASGTCNSVGALGAFGVPNGMPSCSGNPADCIQYDPTSTAQDWQCLPQANLMDDNFEICCADNKYIYTGKCNTIDVASRDSWTCPYGTRKTHVLAS